ncbi:hypothetical protein [Pseudaquabacterium pictum]|uniref:hypothetical protein n=1 Tax=Pseudaquabacterium pictum TaxID=2315236 RepID=UPI0010F5A405|nr:hypothetical protein [Rubrivivax pictus]
MLTNDSAQTVGGVPQTRGSVQQPFAHGGVVQGTEGSSLVVETLQAAGSLLEVLMRLPQTGGAAGLARCLGTGAGCLPPSLRLLSEKRASVGTNGEVAHGHFKRPPERPEQSNHASVAGRCWPGRLGPDGCDVVLSRIGQPLKIDLRVAGPMRGAQSFCPFRRDDVHGRA